MKVLFYLAPETHIPTKANYEHGAICLAEGFEQLGITFFANVEQWFDNEKQQFLFKQCPVDFEADICIYSTLYFHFNPSIVLKLNSKTFNILLDLDDGYPSFSNTPQYLKFDLILRTHYSLDYKYISNVKPWAFGLSNRIVNELDKTINEHVKNEVYVNYRVGFSVRELSLEEMLPTLAKKFLINHSVTDSIEIKKIETLSKYDYWNQTGRRHNIEYYKQLNNSLISLAFCGSFEKNEPILFYRVKEAVEKRIGLRISKNFNIMNVDSWRFWETLYSNACPVHLDFDYWNLVFPINPVPDKHYIGVKNMNFKQTAERINSIGYDEIKKIGKAGRDFATENYTPLPTAKRLLNMITQY